MPVPVIVTVPVPVPMFVPVMNLAGADDGADAQHSLSKATTCEAHPACNKHAGLCCPTESGVMMQCCDEAVSHWALDAKYIITMPGGASVRKEKSSTSDEIGPVATHYDYGTVFEVLEHEADEHGNDQLKTKDGWLSATCPETGEHVADHLLPAEPGELYVATAPKGLVVREDLEKSSKKVNGIKRGEMFHVFERALSSEGLLRLRVKGGWVSESCSKNGDRVAEPVAPKTSEHYTVTGEGDVILYEDTDLSKPVDHDGVYHKDDNIIVIERFIAPTGKQLLRTSIGWFSETSESGEIVAIRTRSAKKKNDMAQSCEAHPACGTHEGLCCPSATGVMMQCCDTVVSHWEADAKYIITLNDGASVTKEKSSKSEEVMKYAFGQVFDVLEHGTDELGDERLRTKDGWINAACHDTQEHVADHLLPSGEGELYMATAPKGLVVRGTLEKSESAKVDSLKRGELFRVLERAINSEGIIRLRTADGWVSETCSKGGDRVAEPVAPKSVEHFTVVAEQIELYKDPQQTFKVDFDGVYMKDNKIDIIERFITPDGKLHLRTNQGWFSEKDETGKVVATRTRGGRSVDASEGASGEAAAEGASGEAAASEGASEKSSEEL